MARPRTAMTWWPHRVKAANGRCGWRCRPCRKGRKIDYINSHGTSTMVGDVTEVEAIRRVFGRGTTPPIASTKSLTGHCLGGAGVWEAIYSLLMMNGNFIAASANVETLDPALDPSEIVTTMRDTVQLD
jgi:3-oxoacyl-[acyl-carrier-protein] synthase-1